MIFHDLEQGSEEWFSARRGIPTASDFGKILTSTGKPSTLSTSYMHTLLAEKLCGQNVDLYTNEWMERGKELEEEARNLFIFHNEIDLSMTGFITDDNQTMGCSPDGWNGEIGLEIKCPKASTHIKYLLENKCPADYIPQVQGSMYITGAQSWWFMSYYPGIDPLIINVKRDESWRELFHEAIEKFQEKLKISLNKLRK